ncbi:GntR family transcriptional regulator [Thiomonas sp. FB-6]|uniref:GntR family transcriptional regulator n=1 Tax=Thiomonas sp. FB-6 TaxID=1158291 RepID=UPI00036D9922|nr:GntR family transcriptional regulator [Thiomonas sp. FB-6]
MSDTLSAGQALGNHLYKEVKHKMLESLRTGEWKPGEVIPSEKKLGERFAVSIGTVRKAVDELSAENVLIRQQGRGTFVASHGRGKYFFSFFHIVRQDGLREFPSVELIDFTRAQADAPTAAALEIDPGDKVWRYTNRLSLQDHAVILDEITVPVELFPRLSERVLRERRSTVYQLYQEHAGVNVIHTRERVRATKADAARARLLQVSPGHPLLLLVRIARSFKERAVELRHSYVNTDRHEYAVDLLGDGG